MGSKVTTKHTKHSAKTQVLTLINFSLSFVCVAFRKGTGYLHSSCAHRRRTLAYLQSRDEPMNALGSSHMTK